MIVPMKKATVIVQAKDAQSTVVTLRSMGVLHIEHQTSPAGSDIASLRDDIAFAAGAANILSGPQIAGKHAAIKGKQVREWKQSARHIIESWKRLDQLEEFSRGLKASIKDWQRWGDFDPAEVNSLALKNIFVRLYEIPEKELKNLPGEAIVKKIFLSGGMAGCAVVTYGEPDIPFKKIAMPKMRLSVMRARLEEESRAIEIIKGDLIRHLELLETFIRIKKALEKELELHEAFKGMGHAENLAYIAGYLPYDAVEGLLARARSEKWAVIVRDPSDSDNVPTLIRNPKWVSTLKPVLKLLEILPGYKELDVSPVFLLFLGLFFGMIIGDAGYGALYIGLTMLAQKKFGSKTKDKSIFHLLYYFSGWTILWGLLTGTIFGQGWYLKAGLKPLMPPLNDAKFLQAFCFLLGAFHLTLGHVWQAIRKAPSLVALADAGWILVLWSAFFFAKMLILSDPLPAFVKVLLITGIFMVILFTNPQKNILKAIGGGLGTLALSIMNNFTDVVSYIRLFAVGMAGVAIADTVNTMAAAFGSGNVFVRLAILFVGHTINITLGPISVMVHGVRLNVLEFSSHAGLTWSGSPYKPLELPGKEQ